MTDIKLKDTILDVSKLFDLTGKTALVSGATGALGSAAAKALASAGAHVVIAGGNTEKLDAVAQELIDAGASATMISERPDDENAATRIALKTQSVSGNIDIVIAASGMSVVEPIIDMEVETWDAVMDANVRQTWLLCRAVGCVMTQQVNEGSIVLISSVRSRFAGAAGTSAYGTSKAAVNMITRSLATEWGTHNIRVNAIAPTVFQSELTAWMFEDNEEAIQNREEVLKRIPLGRLAQPEDFSGVLVFLASQASALITGQIINIDGGFSCN